MQGDDLSILLFWITLAVTFGYEAVKVETTKLRRIGLGVLAGILPAMWRLLASIKEDLAAADGSYGGHRYQSSDVVYPVHFRCGHRDFWRPKARGEKDRGGRDRGLGNDCPALTGTPRFTRGV